MSESINGDLSASGSDAVVKAAAELLKRTFQASPLRSDWIFKECAEELLAAGLLAVDVPDEAVPPA